MEGSDGAILRARAMYAESPDVYFYPDQYNNPGNWRAHYDTTAPEIIEQTSGRITHFVAGLGTSGTFVGAGRRLREFNPAIRLISVQPDSPLHGLEGLKHMDTAIVPGIYDPSLADEDIRVSTEEAFDLTRRLAREGLFVGISSGANLAGALRVARGGVERGDGRRVLRRRREVSVRAVLGRRRRVRRGRALNGAHAASRVFPTRFGDTAPRRIRTSAAARSLDAMAWSAARSPCRTPPRKDRADGSSCVPTTIDRPKSARATEGGDLLGFYHSHPDHPARPSQYDLDHAWPFFSYIIVSVQKGEPQDMTSWRLREDRSAFDQEDLTHA